MTYPTDNSRHPWWKRVGAVAFVVLAGYGAGHIAAKLTQYAGTL